jgi:hypothetical protein
MRFLRTTLASGGDEFRESVDRNIDAVVYRVLKL